MNYILNVQSEEGKLVCKINKACKEIEIEILEYNENTWKLESIIKLNTGAFEKYPFS